MSQKASFPIHPVIYRNKETLRNKDREIKRYKYYTERQITRRKSNRNIEIDTDMYNSYMQYITMRLREIEKGRYTIQRQREGETLRQREETQIQITQRDRDADYIERQRDLSQLEIQ